MDDTKEPQREKVIVPLDLVNLEDGQTTLEKVGLLLRVEEESIDASKLVLVHSAGEIAQVELVRRDVDVPHTKVVILLQDLRYVRDIPVKVIEHRIDRLVRLKENLLRRILPANMRLRLIELTMVALGAFTAVVGISILQVFDDRFRHPVVPVSEELVNEEHQIRVCLSRPAVLRRIDGLQKRKEELITGRRVLSVRIHIVPLLTATERIEPERMFRIIGIIDAILAIRFLTDNLTQALIRVTDINDGNVLAGFIEILNKGIHRKRLTGTGRTDDNAVHIVDILVLTGNLLDIYRYRSQGLPITDMDNTLRHTVVIAIPEAMTEKSGNLAGKEPVITAFSRSTGNGRIMHQGSDTRLLNHTHGQIGMERSHHLVTDILQFALIAPGHQVHETLDSRCILLGRGQQITGELFAADGILRGEIRKGIHQPALLVQFTLNGTMRKRQYIAVDDMGDLQTITDRGASGQIDPRSAGRHLLDGLNGRDHRRISVAILNIPGLQMTVAINDTVIMELIIILRSAVLVKVKIICYDTLVFTQGAQPQQIIRGELFKHQKAVATQDSGEL